MPERDSPPAREAAVFVAGHAGLAGSAVVRALERNGYANLLTPSSSELDLTDQRRVGRFFAKKRIDHVVLAAARVGGIVANSDYPVHFLYENLMIEGNVIHAALETGVERLLFLGSSCIYPREAEQPIREESLLTGPLEETNAPYAVAKIAGIELCAACNRQYGTRYRCVMLPNLYGPGDNFHPEASHVVPALVRRFHEAAARGDDSAVIWGSGEPMREFLHVDDAAAAVLFLMELGDDRFHRYAPPGRPMVNAGTSREHSIADLARLVARHSRFEGRIDFDRSKPDGTPRKLLDSSRIRAMGWAPRIPLEEGLETLCAWYAGRAGGPIRGRSVEERRAGAEGGRR